MTCSSLRPFRRRLRGGWWAIVRLIPASCLALAAMCTSLCPARAVTIDWVTVGNPGNPSNGGYGGVEESFRIGKYEVTIQQYTDFLNAVAATDPYSLYNGSMGTNLNIAGIARSGTSGGYTYSVINNGGNSANRPITYVSWFDAARFANWMHNGQGSGSTETGAYTLNGAVGVSAPARNAGAKFYVPTQDQWYKAAYYSGDPIVGYWDYATQSNTLPGNLIGSEANQANFPNGVYSVTQMGDYNPSQNYLTDVGSFTNSPSAYGTFDQSGNVWEWNDLSGVDAGSSRGLRGGAWNSGSGYLSSAYGSSGLTDEDDSIGFRLASPVAVPEPSTWVMGLAGLACGSWQVLRRRKRIADKKVNKKVTATKSGSLVSTVALAIGMAFLAAAPANAVTIDWVTVGDPGNAADTTGYGAVAEAFRIGKYEVTIQQYTEFLNTVDPAGTNTYSLYRNSMASDASIGGILFSSGSANGQKYSVINNSGNSGNRPITYVSWFDAARFANWMHNGQGTGSTETGAYTLVGGQTFGTAPARNSGAQFYIPTENQWYKAAYYKGGGTSAGYWTYATQSDSAPGNTIGSGANQANYNNGVFSVTQSPNYSWSQNYLTDVGAFTNSQSAYGTFDQSGNVLEWNDLIGAAGSSRAVRGGDWYGSAGYLSSSNISRGPVVPWYEDYPFGFRLASPVASPSGVPEIDPAGFGSVAALLTGALGLLERRRKR